MVRGNKARKGTFKTSDSGLEGSQLESFPLKPMGILGSGGQSPSSTTACQ